MKAYSNYKFYISQYGGETLSEFAFDKAAKKASAYIDKITFGRAEDYVESPEHEMQYCVCEMAETLKSYEDNMVNGRLVTEVSNQGYREVYATQHAGTTEKAVEYSLYDIAKLYLPAELLELNVEA